MLGSPNRPIWLLCSSLRRLALSENVPAGDDEIKERALIAVHLTSTAIETFVNVFFSVAVLDQRYQSAAPEIEKQIRTYSLKKKLQKWPLKLFGHTFSEDDLVLRDFSDLQDLRHSFVHFKPEFQSLMLDSHIALASAVNMGRWNELTIEKPREAYQLLLRIVRQVGTFRGEDPRSFVQSWTGVIDE